MSDNLHKRGVQDRNRISLTEAHEVRYWTGALGVTAEQLKLVVEKVGDKAEAVRRELGK